MVSIVRKMEDVTDYYANYEVSPSEHELYENEYDYPRPYSSDEIDYFYNDNPYRPNSESDYKDTFPFDINHFYPKTKRKHDKGYDSKT